MTALNEAAFETFICDHITAHGGYRSVKFGNADFDAPLDMTGQLDIAGVAA